MVRSADFFVLAVCWLILVWEVGALALADGSTISERVRYWTQFAPWVRAVYVALAVVLYWHFWGRPRP